MNMGRLSFFAIFAVVAGSALVGCSSKEVAQNEPSDTTTVASSEMTPGTTVAQNTATANLGTGSSGASH